MIFYLAFFIGLVTIKERIFIAMFALQLSFDGSTYVKFSKSIIGEMVMFPELSIQVCRVIENEYREIYRLILDRAKNRECSFFVRGKIIEGELHITVSRPDCGIFDVIDSAIFPLKRDRLSIDYVKCQKTYTIKPNTEWLRKDLRLTGVIK